MKKLFALTLILLYTPMIALPASRKNVKTANDISSAIELISTANNSLKRVVMDNGIVCLIKEDHSAPVVSVQFWLGTGSIHENNYLGAGICHAIEHMIFKGTDTTAPGDMTKAINDAGGTINAYTTLDRTVFHTDLPSSGWKTGLSVLANALMHSNFPKEEWKKERKVILREMAMGKDDPNRVLSKMLWRTAFSAHPYRFPVIGYEDIFITTTHEDLLSFSRNNYVPDNLIAVIVGDINAGEVEKELRSTFSDFRRKARAPVVLPTEPTQVSERFARETGVYNISRLEWAYHTVALSHPDAAALDMLAQITGSGRSSRLVRKIKEDLKLVHSIDSWSHTPKEPGLFGISSAFQPDNEKSAIAAIQAEIDSWASSDFTKAEISKARRMILSSELLDLQTMKGQATSFASGEFYAQNPRFSEEYLRQLALVTASDIQRVATTYLTKNNRTLVILAPDGDEADTPPEITASIHPMRTLTLKNGVSLLVREDNRLPFVYICAALGGGVLSENSSNAGITRLTSQLLVRGTRKRTSQELAVQVESLGAQLFPFSGYNSLGMRAQCLSQDADTILGAMADCLKNPSFPIDEIDKEKKLQAAGIDAQLERPFFLAQESLRQIMFGDHPYSRTPLGTKDTVAKLSRDDVITHFKMLVGTGNIAISIFGNITPEHALELAEKHFDNLQKSTLTKAIPGPIAPELPARAKRRVKKEQAIFLAGFPSPPLTDPKYDALVVLRQAMSGLSSDLGTAIREERGLVYYVGAYNQAGTQAGMFVIYAGTKAEAVDDVETLVKKEIVRLTTQGLREEELKRAVKKIIANYERGLQSNLSTAMTCALNEIYGLGADHLFTTKKRFEAITAKDVQNAAKAVLSTKKIAVSLVLPEKE